MFDKLIESRDSGARRRFARSGAVAFGAHVALVAAAVWGAVRPHAAASAAPLPVLIPWPPGADHSTGTASSRAGGAPRAPVIDVPEDVSVGLPPIDGGLPFDFSAWVSERRGMVRPAQDTGVGGLWSLALPEDPPVVLAGRAPEYPEPLRRSGIPGRVLVEVIVDTLGRAEPSSVAIVASSNQGFDTPALDYVLHALFRPARVRGRAERVLVRLPIDFAIVTAR